MATADVTLTQFQTEIGEAKTAIAGGNFAVARSKAALAAVTLSGLFTNQSIDGRSYALQNDILDKLKSAIDLAERAASNAGATQLVPVQFGRLG